MTIAIISSFPPERCGIAFHTSTLLAGMRATTPDLDVLPVCVGSARPDGVSIVRDDAWSYFDAWQAIDAARCDAALLQHEYGLFGGEDGDFVSRDLPLLQTPLITICHTILRRPSPGQRRVLNEIGAASTYVVAPSNLGARFLSDVYEIALEKIRVIPHGVPESIGSTMDICKRRLGFQGRTILLLHGLLATSKGADLAIEALSRLVADWPDLLLVIAGESHPKTVSAAGDRYRRDCEALVAARGLADHVTMLDQSFSEHELLELLQAADIGLCPYRSREQIVSGTLSSMLAAGKPVVATRFWHGEEAIAAGAAVGIAFEDPQALAAAIADLLARPDETADMGRRGQAFVADANWTLVGGCVLDLLAHEAPHAIAGPRPVVVPNLAHLRKMTTDAGLLQHCKWSIPLFQEGYCTDDNARALMLCLRSADGDAGLEEEVLASLVDRYFGFLLFAYDGGTGRFRNFLSFGHHWLEDAGSEEAHARAMRALAHIPGSRFADGRDDLARQLFAQAAPAVASFGSLRATAIALLAFACHARRTESAAFETIAAAACARLVAAVPEDAGDWDWFERELTWFNAKLPHSLIEYGVVSADHRALDVGLRTLRWLVRQQRSPRGYFQPVGCERPYRPGEPMPLFDQQPIEAWATVEACRAAWDATQDPIWCAEAERAFAWFTGDNVHRLPLHDPRTGACNDALTRTGLNRNQGAESTLAWQLAIVEARSWEPSERRRTRNVRDDAGRGDRP